MKNKKYQLKPALILCGVMAALIIAVFIMAGNVNRNVAKNMSGRILYDCVSGDGASSVELYDFNEKKSVGVSGAAGFGCAFGGVFAGKNRAAFIVDDGAGSGICVYDLDGERALATVMSEKFRYLDIDYCEKTNRIACLCSDGAGWWIEEITPEGDRISGDPVFTLDKEIYAISYTEAGDGIYFVHENGGGGNFKRVDIKDSRLSTLYVPEKETLTGVSVREDTVLLFEKAGEGREIIRYDNKKGRIYRLEFNSGEYRCAAAVPVSSTQYLVSCDAGGRFEIYVCNGSNMVKAEGLLQDAELIISDYISD